MPTVKLAEASERDADNQWGNTARLINMYPEPSGSRIMLKNVLGLTQFATGSSFFIHAMHEMDGGLYAVNGNTLLQVYENGTTQSRGEISASDQVGISSNNGRIVLTSSGNYYAQSGNSLIQPDAGAFDRFGGVEYLANYTILTEQNGRRWQWSAVADPSSLPGLNFQTADASDDNLVRPIAVNGNLWLFKERSTEIWYPTGQANENAFRRVSGGVLDKGLKGFNLATKFDDGIFIITDDGIACITSGGQLQPVSTPNVETAIAQGDPTHCTFHEDEGHRFCTIRFSDRPAWVYDISTAKWHERAYGVEHEAFVGTATGRLGEFWYCGADSGDIYRMVRNGRDASEPMRRTVVSATLENDGKRFRVSEFEIRGRRGISSLNRDLKAMLRTSKDFGRTFSPEKVRKMGGLGDYDQRIIWRNLGQFRQATFEISITDADDITLVSNARAQFA